MKFFLPALVILFTSAHALAISPEIYEISYSSGKTFRHFEFEFTRDNLKLPQDFPNREALDADVVNFNYGQFEVFIPAEKLSLPQQCQSHYIVRMPQTLDLNRADLIAEKQWLFKQLSSVYKGKLASKKAVIEISYRSGCNLFFRTYQGRYISYVGKLNKALTDAAKHEKRVKTLAGQIFSAFQQKTLQQLAKDIFPEQLIIILVDERSGETREARVESWQQLDSWLNNLIGDYPDLPNRGSGEFKQCNGDHCEFIPYLIHNTVFITDLRFSLTQDGPMLLEISLILA